jgi:hypothetical protein
LANLAWIFRKFFIEILYSILKNFPFYGNISMDVGTRGKFLWIYGELRGEST